MHVTSVVHLFLLFSTVQCNSHKESCLPKTSKYEVSAALVPCNPHPQHRSCHYGQSGKLQGYNKNVCLTGKLKNCTKKVVISVKMTNVGPTSSKHEYVVVDEVYDSQTDTIQKLLYPYVLKVKHEPLLQTYRLECEGRINEKCRAMECMKKDANTERRPKKKLWMQKLPWLDSEKKVPCHQKVKRRTVLRMNENIRKNFNPNAYFHGGHFRGCNVTKLINNDRRKQYRNYGRRFKDNSGKFNKQSSALKDDVPVPHDYIRAPFGEKEKAGMSMELPQNEGCDGLRGDSAETYLEQAQPKSCYYENCAVSDIKYYFYKPQEPIVKHHFSVEVFEKHYDTTGSVQWNILTNDRPIFLGTFDAEFQSVDGVLDASYTSKETPLRNFALAFDSMKVLIPQFPYLRGGPENFLLIPDNMIVRTQDSFDPGVHYGSHKKHAYKHCALRYPPKWFWCQDQKRERLGYRGNFFLKNFAKLPPNPLHNTSDCFQNLTFFYEGPHQSYLNIEIKTNFNMMLKSHSSGVITEVYVDATHFEKTDITVKVTNTGLVYAALYVFLTDCPLRLPAGFSNIATSSAVIPPQQQHVFKITVLFPLPKRKFYCSVDAKNYRHEVLAFRRIRFQKNDRCICVWHCCCTCLEADKGLKCRPLPIDHYNAAGFYGGLPFASNYIMSTSFVEDYLILMFNLCLTMTILLLLMGVFKAVIGLCYPPVGRFGLEWYLGLPKSIDRYYESNLRMKPVQYDKLGWPVHPDTRRRCRTTSISTEFTINMVFFLLYPLVLLHAVVVKVFTPDYVNEKIDCDFKDKKRGQRTKMGSCPLVSSPPKSCMKRCAFK